MSDSVLNTIFAYILKRCKTAGDLMQWLQQNGYGPDVITLCDWLLEKLFVKGPLHLQSMYMKTEGNNCSDSVYFCST